MISAQQEAERQALQVVLPEGHSVPASVPWEPPVLTEVLPPALPTLPPLFTEPASLTEPPVFVLPAEPPVLG